MVVRINFKRLMTTVNVVILICPVRASNHVALTTSGAAKSQQGFIKKRIKSKR